MQTSVEGVGVPLAIGLSGVIIIVLDALPNSVTTMVIATAVVCIVWTWAGLRLYRSYTTSLVDALRRQALLDDELPIEADEGEEAAARRLIASGNDREVQLGLDMLTAIASPRSRRELDRMAGDARPEVRLAALSRAVALGREEARDEFREEVRTALYSQDAVVRRAALDAVSSGDSFAVTDVVAALTDPSTASAAAGALERLGDDAAATVASMLGAADPQPSCRSRSWCVVPR